MLKYPLLSEVGSHYGALAVLELNMWTRSVSFVPQKLGLKARATMLGNVDLVLGTLVAIPSVVLCHVFWAHSLYNSTWNLEMMLRLNAA